MQVPAVVPVVTDRARPPAGHYSQTGLAAGMHFAFGRLGMDTPSVAPSAATFHQKSRLALSNDRSTLGLADGLPVSLSHVTADIIGVSSWPALNVVFADILAGDYRPPIVALVPELHFDALIAIDAFTALRSMA
jgi:hypothetical protein